MTRISRRHTQVKAKSSPDVDLSSDHHNSNPKTRKIGGRSGNLKRILALIAKISIFFGILVVVIYFMNDFINPVKETVKPRAITPLPAPKLMDLPMFQGEHRESLYWGTYRPNVYFGIRARTPQSLLAGFMWIGVKDGRYFMRHVCQDSDELSTYGWTHHNGRDYGHQVLVDQELTLTTSFLKSKDKESGYGGDWGIRIEAQIEKSSEDVEKIVHLFFYVADEGGSVINLGGDDMGIHDNHILAFGSRNDVGSWQLHLESKYEFEFHYAGFQTTHIHNLSDLVQANIGTQARKIGRLQLSDTADNAPNILVFQIAAMIPFNLDIAFISGSTGSSLRIEERVKSFMGDSFRSRLDQKKNQFEDKFQEVFNVSDEVSKKWCKVAEDFGMTHQLLGKFMNNLLTLLFT